MQQEPPRSRPPSHAASFPVAPERPFLAFGLGDRPKFVFQGGALRRVSDGAVVHAWAHGGEAAPDPAGGRVLLGGEPVVWEDADGLFWRDGGATACAAESAHRPALPDFADSPWAGTLRALHREILVNVVDGLPVPNFWVYRRPWRRDGAMMAMVLAATGNLGLLERWVASLDDPFDRNNAGNEEPDNLGQTLYLLGVLGLRDHPLVARTAAEARRRLGPDGALAGPTDGRRHAVYGACWLRLGLEACGLDASWVPVPDEPDDYGPLFWMRRDWVPSRAAATPVGYDARYPYLWWAKAHFHRLPVPDDLPADGRLGAALPLSWEQFASQADYTGIAALSPAWAAAHLAAPHTWHAAEMFLYLTGRGG